MTATTPYNIACWYTGWPKIVRQYQL